MTHEISSSRTLRHKRLCPSVSPSVGPSVREHESKSAKTSVLDAFCACEWGTWGVDGGWMPLPTRPQRYCDPASLVFLSFVSSRLISHPFSLLCESLGCTSIGKEVGATSYRL